MRKLNAVLSVIAIAGFACALWRARDSNERLRRENESLRRTLAELSQSQGIIEAAPGTDSLSKEQLDELLKLRGEVTQLRQAANQIIALADENKQLQVSLELEKARPRTAADDPTKKKPEDALPQDIHPKNTWAFRGYSTPEATVESACWAMLHGDRASFLGAFSPDMLEEMTKVAQGDDFEGIKEKMGNAEFRILDRQQISDDQMMLTVYTTQFDSEGNNTGHSENTVFHKINGEWKVTEDKPPGS